jgi:hypothetical protein
MADVLLLFFAALWVLGGGAVVALTVRRGRRQIAARRRERPRELREEAARIDDYIRKVNQATADDELDRLERQKEQGK